MSDGRRSSKRVKKGRISRKGDERVSRPRLTNLKAPGDEGVHDEQKQNKAPQDPDWGISKHLKGVSRPPGGFPDAQTPPHWRLPTEGRESD